MYDICTEYTEIIAGTNNRCANSYMEATKNITASNEKGMKYVENFINSIEQINKKAGNDSRISSSKGNIKSFQGYENITTAIEFVTKNASGTEGVKDLATIKNMLEKFQPLYTESYEKQIRLIMLEYETALYMLITGLSLVIATNIDVENSNNNIMIKKKTGSTHGVILKTCKQFAKELSGTHHKDYLEGLIKASTETSASMKIEESVYTEGIVDEITSTIGLLGNLFNHAGSVFASGKNIFTAVKKSFFGIVPLIRCALYIKYKKKADTILALEQQMGFLQQNIERLEKRTNIDPKKKEEIIKKQQAAIEKYRKKAEKLRAQLTETEKEAATEIAKEDPSMSKTTTDNGPTDDGDFILEGTSIKKHFKKIDMNERNNQFIKDNMKNHSLSKSSKSLDPKDKALADKALAEIKKVTTKDSVRLTLKAKKDKDDDPKGLIKSKFGGTPYWPEDMEWPKYGKDDMILLAQINFAEVPYIKGYPKSGLLQFFCVDDVWYEGSSKSKKKYMTVYHEKPDLNVKQITNIPRSTCTGDIPNDPILDFPNDFPFNGVHYIDKFIKENISINACNEREISDIVMPIINKYFNSNYKYLGNMPNELWDYFITKLSDENHWGHRIGGWPSFTQSDVTTSKYNTLLLQIDSDTTVGKKWSDGIMWGDCGVANIFINDNALSTKDFSDVMFTWDCC